MPFLSATTCSSSASGKHPVLPFRGPTKLVLKFRGEKEEGTCKYGAFGKAGSGSSAVCPDEMRRVDSAIAVSFGLSPERLV